MIAKLPQEIQNTIFSSLSYKEKLTCLFISKSWNKCVQPYLVSSICTSNLESVIAYIKKYPDLKKYVRQLKITNFPDVQSYAAEFAELFPNVSKFTVNNFETIPFNKDSIKLVTPGTWKNVDELNITETNKNQNPTFLETLRYNDCPNVSNLILKASVPPYSLDEIVRNQIVEKFCLCVYDSLRNLPLLSKLVLEPVMCDITGLELIHNNAPNLKSLTLRQARFVASALTRRPQPVHLDTLEIQFEYIPEILTPTLFDYIASKYKGLTSFTLTCPDEELEEFEDEESEDEESEDEEYDDDLSPLFVNNPQLKSLNQIVRPLSSIILESMDECGIQLEELTLYHKQDNIERQFEALLGSKQIETITHLTIVKTDTVDRMSLWSHFQTDPIDFLKRMNNLKHLTVRVLGKNIEFIEIYSYLQCLPQLTSITFDSPVVHHRYYEYGVDETPPFGRILHLQKMDIKQLAISRFDSWVIAARFRSLLPCCVDLEHFALTLDFDFVRASETAIRFIDDRSLGRALSIQLDFSNNDKLKTIEIRNSRETFLEIIRKQPESKEYYYYDLTTNRFERIQSIPLKAYSISIVLAHTVLLNSFEV